MTYKTHINGGLLVGLLITSQINNRLIIPTAVIIGGSVIGSLLPDIDHTKSYIGKRIKPVSKVVNKLAGHRKLFHAPLIYLFLYAICIGYDFDKITLLFIQGIFSGILSHLILDSLTIGGLPWFYPFSKKKFSFAKIKTNSQFEYGFCSVLICLNFAILLDILNIAKIFTFIKH